MTLQLELAAELNRLESTGAGPLAVASGRVTCDLTKLNDLACSFTRLSFRPAAPSRATLAELRRAATALASKLTYLLEPLQLIEADGERCVVQLRSAPPSKSENGTAYYELLASRDGWELCRYAFHKPTSVERQLTPTTVTREVFTRLVNDVASVG